MSDVALTTLRELRGRAEELLTFAETDLKEFLHPYDGVTFLRTPVSERKRGDVNVTTTCSCIMALALTNKFQRVYKNSIDDAPKAFAFVTEAPWESEALKQNNAFTTTLVIRALGFLVEAGIEDSRVSPAAISKLWCLNSKGKPKKQTLAEIARLLGANDENFSINDYDPTAAVIYWFIDGVSRSQIRLPLRTWINFARWAKKEFTHQLSLVVAKHEAMMDPVAMAMSACLCARLRVILESSNSQLLQRGADSDTIGLLPSTIELENSIRELFKHQRNGIWPKYFPLFHYAEAGSNFCFTFELLEAVLTEFGRENNQLLDEEPFIKGLGDAVTWCERNRLKWHGRSKHEYSGWNSGGYLETLERNQPESWATAVVYMFLWELQKVLSERIQKRLLDTFEVPKVPVEMRRNTKELDRFLPIEIFAKGKSRHLKRILRQHFVSKYRDQTEQTLRKQKSKAARSALLFGPPGTSKTEVVEAIAKEIGWPLIQIDPSHFLKRSLDGIYVQAGEIFEDLMDLSGVVVLFDEMDALVETRVAGKLDTTAKFLTTFMLPKLAALHDQGRIIFFMATNFENQFDPAIKRPGRFDLLLCMGPPRLQAKLDAFQKFTEDKKNGTDTKLGRRLISQFARKDPRLEAQLELYTFAEFKSLVKALRGGKSSVAEKLKSMSATDFADFVDNDSETVALRLSDLEPLSIISEEVKTIAQLMRVKITRDRLEQKGISRETPIIQYLIDRRQSRVPPL